MKFLTKFLILLALLCQTSCTLTSNLWNESYDESLKHFLISKDGKYVVFLGREFSYVFTDETGILKETLLWKDRDLLFINIEKTHLNVNLHNAVEGYVVIEGVYNSINPEQTIFLKSMGFKSKSEDEPLALKIKMQGTRYLPIQNDNQKFSSALKRTYVISIHQSPSFGKRAEELALTPITVLADTFLLFGKIILLPFDFE